LHLKILALIAALAALAAGCATPANTAKTSAPAAVAAPAPTQSPADSDRRFIIAPELNGLLHVLSVRSWRQADGFLSFQVNVQNLTDAPQQFNYRIEWFDKDGTPLPLVAQAPLPWTLMGREMSSVVMTAPTRLADDFGIAFVPVVN
jgi:uncharacterized protein YcfL